MLDGNGSSDPMAISLTYAGAYKASRKEMRHIGGANRLAHVHATLPGSYSSAHRHAMEMQQSVRSRRGGRLGCRAR
jgi:hypothetical protein